MVDGAFEGGEQGRRRGGPGTVRGARVLAGYEAAAPRHWSSPGRRLGGILGHSGSAEVEPDPAVPPLVQRIRRMNSTNRLFCSVTVLGAVACVPIGQTNTMQKRRQWPEASVSGPGCDRVRYLGVRYIMARVFLRTTYEQHHSFTGKACEQRRSGCSRLQQSGRSLSGTGVECNKTRFGATACSRKLRGSYCGRVQ